MGQERKITKVFIANRGEIAVRIIHTCKEMDVETVVVYCPADKGSLFTSIADYIHEFDTNDLSATYLNSKKLISIAKQFGCDAVHPGYGFLSENAQFADLCTKEGLIFIGPDSKVISLMGDKISARQKVEKLKIPLLPSVKFSEDTNLEKIKDIGFPVLIKASAGGGGRGMRIVHNEKDLEASIASARREAKNAFGDDTVYMEKYLEFCRHIEVQVLSDYHGNHIHLFERECSIQRRHQKVIEEAPSSTLTQEERKLLCSAALKITKGINYKNAGTVEFLWENGNFYFLEMNTRLQVEHAVTEMITGIDIVKTQIQIAEGKKIPDILEKPTFKGHAIEARIYAENPKNNFLPTGGTIEHVGDCKIPNTRIETSFVDGLNLPLEFDSMLAKVCTWSLDRNSAAKKLIQVLRNITFTGITTNNEYLQKILKSEAFKDRKTFTNFIENFTFGSDAEVPPEVLAAVLIKLNSYTPVLEDNFHNPWLSND